LIKSLTFARQCRVLNRRIVGRAWTIKALIVIIIKLSIFIRWDKNQEIKYYNQKASKMKVIRLKWRIRHFDFGIKRWITRTLLINCKLQRQTNFWNARKGTLNYWTLESFGLLKECKLSSLKRNGSFKISHLFFRDQWYQFEILS